MRLGGRVSQVRVEVGCLVGLDSTHRLARRNVVVTLSTSWIRSPMSTSCLSRVATGGYLHDRDGSSWQSELCMVSI